MMMSESETKLPAVLIVEDQATMRAGIRAYLETAFPGCRILEAGNSARALELLFEYQPDLVLMDIYLPDANGIELTWRLKVLFRKISIIIVSSLSDQEYLDRARLAGALGYIVKDRLAEELIPAVAGALGIRRANGRK